MHVRGRSIALLVAIALFASACGGGSKAPQAATEARVAPKAPGAATITVDFATPIAGRQPLTGILLGMSDAIPPDSLITPLRPQLLRAWPNVVPYSRAVDLNVPYVEMIGDEWGYPYQDWKGHGAPWADFAAWESFVGNIANQFRGRNVIFDIWNNPNNPITWAGTFAQFFETYQRAANVIRSTLGDAAQIAGPEINIYDPTYIGQFMDAARAANLRVDVLTWHETGDPDKVAQIEADAKDARSRWVSNPDYAAVGVKQVGVYESTSQQSQTAPGDAAAVLYYLEAGNVDAAARACWPQANGLSSCTDSTLGGLLTQGNEQPRSSWWAYKLYADGVASRVTSSTTDPLSVALASSSVGTNTAQVLVARSDASASSAKVTVPIDLTGLAQVPFLARATSVVVKARLLPDSGDELDSPIAAGQQTITVTNGTAAVQVDIAAHEVVVLTVTAS